MLGKTVLVATGLVAMSTSQVNAECYAIKRFYPYACEEGACLENPTGYEFGIGQFIYDTYEECCGHGIGMDCAGPMPGPSAGNCFAISSWHPFRCADSATQGTNLCGEVHDETGQVYKYATEEECCKQSPIGDTCAPDSTDTCFGVSNWHPFECESGACYTKHAATNQEFTFSSKDECCNTVGAGCASDLEESPANTALPGDGAGCNDVTDLGFTEWINSESLHCNALRPVDLNVGSPDVGLPDDGCVDDIISRVFSDYMLKSNTRHSFKLERNYTVAFHFGGITQTETITNIIELHDVKPPDMTIVLSLPVSHCPLPIEAPSLGRCQQLSTGVFGSFNKTDDPDKPQGCIAKVGGGMLEFNTHSTGANWGDLSNALENSAMEYFMVCSMDFTEENGGIEYGGHEAVDLPAAGIYDDFADVPKSHYDTYDYSLIEIEGSSWDDAEIPTIPKAFAYHGPDNCAEGQPHGLAVSTEFSYSGTIGGIFTIQDYSGNERRAELYVELYEQPDDIITTWTPIYGAIKVD